MNAIRIQHRNRAFNAARRSEIFYKTIIVINISAKDIYILGKDICAWPRLIRPHRTYSYIPTNAIARRSVTSDRRGLTG